MKEKTVCKHDWKEEIYKKWVCLNCGDERPPKISEKSEKEHDTGVVTSRKQETSNLVASSENFSAIKEQVLGTVKREYPQEFLNISTGIKVTDVTAIDYAIDLTEQLVRKDCERTFAKSSIKNGKWEKFGTDEFCQWCGVDAFQRICPSCFKEIIEQEVKSQREKCEAELKYKGFTAEQWESQFAQAKMIIEDIKKVIGCKSDDGVEILESVERTKQAKSELTGEIEKIFIEIDEYFVMHPEILTKFQALQIIKFKLLEALKGEK